MNFIIEYPYIVIMIVALIAITIGLLTPRARAYQPTRLRQRPRYETKIKMFRGSDILTLERNISEWLKDNHQNVKEITYQNNLTVMIIYRPRIEPTPPQDE